MTHCYHIWALVYNGTMEMRFHECFDNRSTANSRIRSWQALGTLSRNAPTNQYGIDWVKAADARRLSVRKCYGPTYCPCCQD